MKNEKNRSPIHPNQTITKRIVGLQGDLIATRPPYPVERIVVPIGHVWVEGDEQFHSRDSNEYGPVGII